MDEKREGANGRKANAAVHGDRSCRPVGRKLGALGVWLVLAPNFAPVVREPRPTNGFAPRPCRAERTGLLRAWAYEISNSRKFGN